MTRTILHIGAHKTASTYMQHKLALNAELLATNGVHYETLETLRKRFTPLLKHPPVENDAFMQELLKARQTHDVFLSEENIMGVPGDIVRHGVYYSKAGSRLAQAAHVLRDDQPAIFIALREYASFTVSMYSEYIRHREFMHFEPYFETYKKSKFSWIRVIEDVVAAVPHAKLYLWDFGQFRSIERDVFAAMLGFDPSVLTEPVGPVRESFSDAAVRAIGALSGALPQRDIKKLIAPIARTLPRGTVYAAFDPMDPEMRALLKQQYQDDLATIARKFPAITFIGPWPGIC